MPSRITSALSLMLAGAVLWQNPGYGGATLPAHRFDSQRQCWQERHNYADEPSREDRNRGAFLECGGRNSEDDE